MTWSEIEERLVLPYEFNFTAEKARSMNLIQFPARSIVRATEGDMTVYALNAMFKLPVVFFDEIDWAEEKYEGVIICIHCSLREAMQNQDFRRIYENSIKVIVVIKEIGYE